MLWGGFQIRAPITGPYPEVANFARMPALALESARIWHETEPASAQALQALTVLLIGTRRVDFFVEGKVMVEIKAVTLAPVAGSREQRRLFDFSMRVTLTQPAAAAPAAGASAPAKSV